MGADSESLNSGNFDLSTPANLMPNGCLDVLQNGDSKVSAFANDSGNYDCQSSSVIKLTNGSVMVLKEVNKYLALVFIIRDDHYNVSHSGLLAFVEL